MTYKEVFQLAQDKGFVLTIAKSVGTTGDGKFVINVADYLWEYRNGEQMESTYIELCLIQKWLREEKSISVVVSDTYVTQDYKVITRMLYSNETLFVELFSSYDEALLNGINEALKLI